MKANVSLMEEAQSNLSASESSDDDLQQTEDKFATTMQLMEESRKRKLSNGSGNYNTEEEDDFVPPPKKKMVSPTTNDPKFLEVAHGISFNQERNKFEASVRVLNEETGNFDDFILGYFETNEWAARVRDAWIVLHKVRNNKLNLNGKFDQKACAQVQKMNSVLREHIQTDTTKTKTMIALMHNMMKNEKIMKDIVMKLRAKIAQIDRQSPLVTWIDKELQKVQPIKRSATQNQHQSQKPKPTLDSRPRAMRLPVKVKRESVQGYWTIRTDGYLIKLFGKHGSNYERIANELRRRFSMPYDAKMVDERISRLTKSIQKRVQPKRSSLGTVMSYNSFRKMKLWTPQKDAMLRNLVIKFGEDFQFLSTAMGDEFTVRELRERVRLLSATTNPLQIKRETPQ